MPSATPTSTKQWQVKEYPTADFDEKKVFELATKPLFGDDGKAGAKGKVLLKMRYFSHDPAQKTWIGDHDPKKHYMPPVKIGHVMSALGVGQVVESFHDDFKTGDFVFSFYSWSEYLLMDVEAMKATPFPLTKIPEGVDPTDILTAGVTGVTAWLGLFKTAQATSKDKVVIVSGAAGATGFAVTQFAKKVLGVEYVVGIAGSDEKCKMCRETGGCDLAVNYKTAGWQRELYEGVDRHGGANVYFDNVGGSISSFIFEECMAKNGRVAVCGAISGYADDKSGGITTKAFRQIVFNTLRVEGFLLPNCPKDIPIATNEITQWIQEGKYKPVKDLRKVKFDQVPVGMAELLKGANTGKLIYEVTD